MASIRGRKVVLWKGCEKIRLDIKTALHTVPTRVLAKTVFTATFFVDSIKKSKHREVIIVKVTSNTIGMNVCVNYINMGSWCYGLTCINGRPFNPSSTKGSKRSDLRWERVGSWDQNVGCSRMMGDRRGMSH